MALHKLKTLKKYRHISYPFSTHVCCWDDISDIEVGCWGGVEWVVGVAGWSVCVCVLCCFPGKIRYVLHGQNPFKSILISNQLVTQVIQTLRPSEYMILDQGRLSHCGHITGGLQWHNSELLLQYMFRTKFMEGRTTLSKFQVTISHSHDFTYIEGTSSMQNFVSIAIVKWDPKHRLLSHHKDGRVTYYFHWYPRYLYEYTS